MPRKDHPDFVTSKDSNHSDIDVLAIHPKLSGPEAVIAVSCKSWQQGFNPASEIAAIDGDKVVRGRKAWQAFRELCVPKWSEAFIAAVREATGREEFTYALAIAHVRGDKGVWENHQPFLDALGGNPIKVITFQDMIEEIYEQLGTTLAATEVGRMLQMFRAAKIEVNTS